MIRNLHETQMSWNLGNIRSMYKRSITYDPLQLILETSIFGTRICQFYFFEITTGNEAWSKILRLPRRKSKVATFQERAKSRESFWNYGIEKSERIGREMSRRYRGGWEKNEFFFPRYSLSIAANKIAAVASRPTDPIPIPRFSYFPWPRRVQIELSKYVSARIGQRRTLKSTGLLTWLCNKRQSYTVIFKPKRLGSSVFISHFKYVK